MLFIVFVQAAHVQLSEAEHVNQNHFVQSHGLIIFIHDSRLQLQPRARLIQAHTVLIVIVAFCEV